MKKRRRSQGFTLVEVIISIAVLSIVSVFILQMFVTSAQLNANARDIDKVNMWTSTLMESFHIQRDPMAFDKDDVFSYVASALEEEQLVITCYFDGDWMPVQQDDERTFMLRAVVTHEEDGPSTRTSLQSDALSVHGALYSLQVEFYHLDAGGHDVRLSATNSTNYFQIEEALP